MEFTYEKKMKLGMSNLQPLRPPGMDLIRNNLIDRKNYFDGNLNSPQNSKLKKPRYKIKK